MIHNHAPGQKVTLVVARGMATRTLTLTAVEPQN
jgi:hypothetical protein